MIEPDERCSSVRARTLIAPEYERMWNFEGSSALVCSHLALAARASNPESEEMSCSVANAGFAMLSIRSTVPADEAGDWIAARAGVVASTST
jgi:hypothetical protein